MEGLLTTIGGQSITLHSFIDFLQCYRIGFEKFPRLCNPLRCCEAYHVTWCGHRIASQQFCSKSFTSNVICFQHYRIGFKLLNFVTLSATQVPFILPPVCFGQVQMTPAQHREFERLVAQTDALNLQDPPAASGNGGSSPSAWQNSTDPVCCSVTKSIT